MGVTTQNTTIWIHNAVETSNLISISLSFLPETIRGRFNKITMDEEEEEEEICVLVSASCHGNLPELCTRVSDLLDSRSPCY
jgi:hypothetical protein